LSSKITEKYSGDINSTAGFTWYKNMGIKSGIMADIAFATEK
jgi:hypothetical protein